MFSFLNSGFPAIDCPILVGFAIASAMLALSPGPDNIFVLAQSLARGARSGLAVVFGLVSGCLVHTALLAFGISEIIKKGNALFWAVKLFGALYLIYLAYKVFKSDSNINLAQSFLDRFYDERAQPQGRSFLFSLFSRVSS